jgi:peptide/nickel transport system permease protein
MIRFLAKRMFYGFLVLLGVVCLVFVLFVALPSPEQASLGQRSDVSTAEAVKKEMGLDLPRHQQFLLYLNDVSPISFHLRSKANDEKYNYFALVTISGNSLVVKKPYLRTSYQSKRKVSSILSDAFVGTFVLAISALLLAILLGVTLGIIAALKHNSWIDHLSLFVSTIGISLPSFFSSIIIAWLFGFVLSEYTGLSLSGSLYDYDVLGDEKIIQWKNLILPAIALGIRPFAILTQLTRSSMIEVMGQDYIRTAKAKGLTNTQVVVNHALKNALNPVVTAISGWFASMLAGAFFVEIIFNWKGLGKVTIEALQKSDLPVIMGSVLFVAFLFVMINIVVDVLYKYLDPRVELS